MNKKIVFIHQLNNFSGSPLVLSHVIKVAKKHFESIDLITNGHDGFLKEENCKIKILPYKRFDFKFLTLFSFFIYQLRLIILLFNYRKDNVIFYVNTLMPFSAGIVGFILGNKTIFHHHEASVNNFIKFIAKKIISISSYKNIFVSNFLFEQENIKSIKSEVIYNTLSNEFAKKALSTPFIIDEKIYVLMLCSLRKYKGVDSFIEISKLCSKYPLIQFELVVDANSNQIKKYFGNIDDLKNLKIYSGSKTKIHNHFKKANILLNLSDKNKWIETFGMTILEGMAYGIPSITPEVGGPIELVEDHINGFNIDSFKVEKISSTIIRLYKNPNELKQLSDASRKKFYEFEFSIFENKMDRFFKDLKS
tara:strand:+ start:12482 stop:13573 length:1092 start_codon:yes stop_codon:yes gene_type:complete